MITLDTMTTFFGWLTVLNFGFLIFTSFILMLVREPIIRLHSKLSGVDPEKIPLVYFNFIGNYKLAIFVFNLTPYVALRLMS